MILSDEFLEFYVLMCRTISKPVRLKILHLIGDGKQNVGEMQKKLGVSMSSLSNHLNDLYRSGILGREKQGNFVFYYLNQPELLEAISGMQCVIKDIDGRRGKPGYK